MKTVLIQTDSTIGSLEYGRMLELELADRGVRIVAEEQEGVSAVLVVCDVCEEKTVEKAENLAKRLHFPVLICGREFRVPLPVGVMSAERPLDVKRLCDALAAEETERSEPITPAFVIDTAKEGIVIDRLRRTVTCQGEPISLTAREFDLLAYLDERRGTPASREEITREVWGLPISQTNVVDVYIRYLRQKLDEPFDTRFILTVRGKGYVLK